MQAAVAQLDSDASRSCRELDAAVQREAQLQLKADELQARDGRAPGWVCYASGFADIRPQAQLTSAALDGLDIDTGRSHVDVLEENLKRQIQETEALRHDVLNKKLELEKQTASLNSLIASIHAAQRNGSPAPALADDYHTPLSDTRGSLSPIKRVPSDGDDLKSPLNSSEGDGDSTQGEEALDEAEGGSGASSDDDSDDGGGCGRQRQRLLSIVAEVDGEDESLGEQKVRLLLRRRATRAHVCLRSFCLCCTLEKL